jgi:hypothetical protein
MRITKNHFFDTAVDSNGQCSYHYEGDIYEIECEDVTYRARSYAYTPDEIAFLGRVSLNDAVCILDDIPYGDPEFLRCVNYFKNDLGFTEFKVHCRSSQHGYAPVELAKINF